MTSAEAALDALRRWAATSRADLVAAAWYAGNRNITALAAAAGRGRDVIYADLHARGIDPKIDRQEPPMPTTTPSGITEIPVPGWRHPHLTYVRVDTQYGWKRYDPGTVPFTGDEPEPELPAEWATVHPTDSDLPEGNPHRWDKYNQRTIEIDLVRRVWAVARFEKTVGQLLKQPHRHAEPAAAYWATYAAARDNLTAAYAALDTTPDNQWRSALLAIVDAKEPAEAAASNWDGVASVFAEQDQWLLRQVGEEDHPVRAVQNAAEKHGVDTSDWLIGSMYDYERGHWGRTPAVDEIHRIIEKGDERIRAVEDLLKD